MSQDFKNAEQKTGRAGKRLSSKETASQATRKKAAIEAWEEPPVERRRTATAQKRGEEGVQYLRALYRGKFLIRFAT